MGQYSRIRGSLEKPGGKKGGVATVSRESAPRSRAPVAIPKQRPTENELEICEREISESFERWTAAFARIKKKQLYKLAGYADFTEYCEKKWGFSRDRGYQILAAEEVLESVGPKCRPLVGTERQARALSEVPKEQRREVLKQIAAAGPVTTKAIRQAVASTTKAPPAVIDVQPEKQIPLVATSEPMKPRATTDADSSLEAEPATIATTPSPAVENDFIRGVVYACARMIELYDQPTMAASILRESGAENSDLKRCAEYDLAFLRKENPKIPQGVD